MKHYTIIENETLKIEQFLKLNKELKLLYLVLVINEDYQGYIENTNLILKEYDFKQADLNELVKNGLLLKSPYLSNLYINRYKPRNTQTTKKTLFSKYDQIHKNLFVNNENLYEFVDLKQEPLIDTKTNIRKEPKETKNSNIKTEIKTISKENNQVIKEPNEPIENIYQFTENKKINETMKTILLFYSLCGYDTDNIQEYFNNLKDENNINIKSLSTDELNQVEKIINDLTIEQQNKINILDKYIKE